MENKDWIQGDGGLYKIVDGHPRYKMETSTKNYLEQSLKDSMNHTPKLHEIYRILRQDIDPIYLEQTAGSNMYRLRHTLRLKFAQQIVRALGGLHEQDIKRLEKYITDAAKDDSPREVQVPV